MYLYCTHYSNMQTNPKLPPKYDTHNPEYTHTHTHTRDIRDNEIDGTRILYTLSAQNFSRSVVVIILYIIALFVDQWKPCVNTHTHARAQSHALTKPSYRRLAYYIPNRHATHARCHARAHIDKYICNVHMYLKRYQRFMCVVSRIARQFGWMNEWILHIMYRAISTDWNAKHSSLARVYTRYNNMYLRSGGANISACALFMVGCWTLVWRHSRANNIQAKQKRHI